MCTGTSTVIACLDHSDPTKLYIKLRQTTTVSTHFARNRLTISRGPVGLVQAREELVIVKALSNKIVMKLKS
mgnify:FL=1